MPENNEDIRMDWDRRSRSGIPEVVLADRKSDEQLRKIAAQAFENDESLFFTRVSADQARVLSNHFDQGIHYHTESKTLYIGQSPLQAEVQQSSHSGSSTRPVAIVAAGTSDVPVVAEIEQTLLYLGVESARYVDVGVAGLWRLMALSDPLNEHAIVIAVAGMEGALFSVVSGLVKAPVIAVPTSVGYGVGAGGYAALNAALCGCSPGLAVMNIDNGFGAAALAAKMLRLHVPAT